MRYPPFFLTVSFFLTLSCQARPPGETGAQLVSARDSFPSDRITESWFASLTQLDLDGDATRFEMSSGGTSVYARVYHNSENPIGAFLPENSATNPNTEIATYNLGRILGYGDYFQTAVYWKLGSNGVQKFKRMLGSFALSSFGKWKLSNWQDLKAKLSEQGSLEGAYKGWQQGKPIEYSAIEDSGRVGNGGLKANHFVTQMIQASGPRPTERPVTLFSEGKYRNHRSTESALAHQLSTIVVVDALMGQWDRYSGGNMSLRATADGKISFFAVDNGGATVSSGSNWARRQASWLSRYDRDVIAELTRMHEFLSGKTSEYFGYTSREDFLKALGLRVVTKAEPSLSRLHQGFVRNLGLLLESVENNRRQHGNQIYF